MMNFVRVIRDHLHEVTGKTVLVRCNYDVPLVDGKVGDTTRIEDSVETVKLLLEQGCKVVLLAHLGRPDGEVVPEKSLKPVHEELERLFGETVIFQTELEADAVREAPARLVLIENLRFFPGETKNDEAFVEQLASLGDVYVNEAFANCHREHASIVGLAQKLPSFAGLHLANEVEILLKVRNNPEKPLVLVVGGAKVATKAPLVEAFKDKADLILVGGKIAEELAHDHKQLDHVILAENLPDGKDISQQSANLFAAKIQEAKTVIWNGTMGVFEEESYRLGTDIIARAVDSTDAFTVVGGGDTEAALTILDLEANLNHLSTGGGAMLDLLVDGKLPGVEVLEN